MAERSLLPRRPEDECLPPAHIAAEQFAAERETWVTVARAAMLAGVSPSTIRRATRQRLTSCLIQAGRRFLLHVWLDDVRRFYPKTPMRTSA